LAIARALVKAAPIVVLDEATSALDPVTEAAVLDALRTRLANSSVLLVAHRQSTIQYADRIITLKAGRVAT
jgi:ABC-type bacteriocin/lantibiotic exporter with double-glycine peptidase domain